MRPPWGLTGARAEAAPCPCRCTRRAECPRAEESGHWLWSRDKSCVAVTGAQPQNMSRRAQGEVCARAGGGGLPLAWRHPPPRPHSIWIKWDQALEASPGGGCPRAPRPGRRVLV